MVVATRNSAFSCLLRSESGFVGVFLLYIEEEPNPTFPISLLRYFNWYSCSGDRANNYRHILTSLVAVSLAQQFPRIPADPTVTKSLLVRSNISVYAVEKQEESEKSGKQENCLGFERRLYGNRDRYLSCPSLL